MDRLKAMMVLSNFWNILTFAIVAISFGYLLVEIFEFSESFSLSAVRQIDDPVYHIDIRKIHEAIIHFRLDDLLRLNNNGYGWIFWFIHGLLSIPAFILSKLGFETPIIVSGRLISWGFSLASVFFIFKSLKFFINSKALQFYALLIFITFPHIPNWAMRFSSETQSFFFGVLSFYFTVRREEYQRNDLKLIALALAASVGTKLTGVFLIPFIGFRLLQSYNWGRKKNTLADATFFFGVFIVATLFFINPGFFLIPFTTKFYRYYIDTFKTYMTYVNSNSGNPTDILYLFKESIAGSFLGAFSTFIALLLILLNGVKDYRAKATFKFDYIVAFFSLVVTFIYLAIRVKKGPPYITLYFHSICFLYCLAFSFLDRFKRIGIYLGAALALFFLVENSSNIYRSFNTYYIMRQNQNVKDLVIANQDLANIIGPLTSYPNGINVLVDYRAIFPFTFLDKGVKYIVLIDDLNMRKLWSSREFDFVVLSRNSTAFAPEEVYANTLALSDPATAQRYRSDKADTLTLVNDLKLKLSSYQRIYDKNGVIAFKRISTETEYPN